MKIKMQSLKRTAYVAAAFALALAGIFQGLLSQRVYAAFDPNGSQIIDREIRMSSSAAGVTSTYLVAFEPATSYQIKGIIVDFCGGAGASGGAGTPILGDTACSIPDGFDIGTPTVVTTSVDSNTGFTDLGDGTGSWTAANPGTNNRTLRLTNANGPTLSTSTRYQFAITGVTNPTDVETFYARILTYTSDTGDILTYAPGDEGDDTTLEDYGGIALSVVNVINITAKVQETLTFCVSLADPDPGCTNTSAPVLTLGHGTNNILDNTATDTDAGFMQASTNAQSGINVRIKNSNSCGGLSRDGGTTCDIAPAGAAATAITAGASALFGLSVTSDTNLLSVAPYSTGSQYGMDNATAGNEVSSTFGSLISQSSVPLDGEENQLTFAATATVTTPAGLYSADMTIIATGTF
jgi:hypothetical protein